MAATTKRIVRSVIPETDWAEVEEGREENRRDEAGRSGDLAEYHEQSIALFYFSTWREQKHDGDNETTIS